MTELETKLLAQVKGLISAIESNSGAEPSLSVLCREVDLAKALIAEAETARPQIGVGQVWRDRRGCHVKIVRKLDEPDRYGRQYIDAIGATYRHDGSFNGDGGFPCGYDLVELVGKEDRQ